MSNAAGLCLAVLVFAIGVLSVLSRADLRGRIERLEAQTNQAAASAHVWDWITNGLASSTNR